jgi:hypothetical protein
LGKSPFAYELYNLPEVLFTEIPSSSEINVSALDQAATEYARTHLDDNATTYAALRVIEEFFNENASKEAQQRLENQWKMSLGGNTSSAFGKKLNFDGMRVGVTLLREELETKLTPHEKAEAERALY